MQISVKSLLQIAFYSIVIASLVVINLNQLALTKAEQSPISAPITAPVFTPAPTSTPEPRVAPRPTPQAHHDDGGSNDHHDNGGSNNSGGSSGPSVCGDQRPGTPVLLNVIKTGPNQVMIIWSKPVGPVSNYVLAYGLTPVKMLYGNPNVGNTNTYVVNHLQANTAYYFRVRAQNGCTPGEFSNPMGVSAYGRILAPVNSTLVVAPGFKAEVLSAKKSYQSPVNNASTPIQVPVIYQPAVKLPDFNLSQTADSIFGKVLHFLYH